MNYFVLQVLTGEEQKFIKLAQYNLAAEHTAGLEQVHFIWPKRKLTIRRRGKLTDKVASIFPGYVFLQTETIDPDLYWILKRTSGFVRFMKNNKEIEPIHGDDKKLLLHFLSFGEIVEKSRVWFDKDNVIRVASGPMKGLEGRIIKVDRRKKRAKIKLSLYDESFKIDFGFEILEKVEDEKERKK